MSEIKMIKFSKKDREILSQLDIPFLKSSINFLCSYKSVLWEHGDSGKVYPKDALPKSKKQSKPKYPKELLFMGRYFNELICEDYADLAEEGFFNIDKRAVCQLGTMFSPYLIASYISDAFQREPFCDGLFGVGVSNFLYLKMLMHLIDCKYLYDEQEQIIKEDRILNSIVNKLNEYDFLTTSLIQKNFSISYPKASHYLNTLIEYGFVAEQKENKGFKVLRG